jgi:hypothetical protein
MPVIRQMDGRVVRIEDVAAKAKARNRALRHQRDRRAAHDVRARTQRPR